MKKLLIAAAAAATLGIAAFSSTSASAFWPGYGWHPHPHWGYGWHPHPGYWGGPVGYPDDDSFPRCHFVPYPWPHKVCHFTPF
jgi:hypothetical protein